MRLSILLILITVVLYGKSYSDNGYILFNKDFNSCDSSDGTSANAVLDTTIVNYDYMYLTNDNKVVLSVNYTGVRGTANNIKYKVPIGDYDIINITNLYYSRVLSDNYVVSAGVFNFKTSTFNNDALYGDTVGLGIYNMVDFELEGVLFTYKNDNINITTGVISKGNVIKTAYVLDTNEQTDKNEAMLSVFDGSYGYALLIKDEISDFLTLDFNYYHYNEKLYDLDSKTIDLAAISLKYDLSETSGDVIYMSMAMSKTKGDGSVFISRDAGIPYTNVYHEKYDVSGMQALIGYNKTFDTFLNRYSLTLGCEASYVGDGADDMSVGSPLSMNVSGGLGLAYKAFTSLRVNKHLVLNLVYAGYDNNTGKTTMLHGIPVTKKLESTDLTGKSSRKIQLGLIYKF